MEDIQPGLMVVHGNRMEDLRALAIAWLGRHPLAPLESETILVQSNGVAQWLKLALAAGSGQGGLGIAAALDVQLPSRFLWQAYRAVLGAQAVQRDSPWDKERLAWRLLRLLPGLLAQPEFAPLSAYLAGDGDLRKRHQLAERLADLLDQYQVYRADWLSAWESGRDELPGLHGACVSLPPGQGWQPRLWRALAADIGVDGASRAEVHRRFLEGARALPGRPAGLPRRLTVFGLSSLPAQGLEALAALASYCQVLVFVLNPCRHYWADIVAGRDLLRAPRRRQAPRPGAPEAPDEESLHLVAQPLLAAWGRQGRDYVRLLDEYDDPESYRRRFESSALPPELRRLDLFSAPDPARLLGQLQDDILELRPLAETLERWPPVAPEDDSIRFHVAHGRQREVEILHDRLLARFDADPTLRPREVIVMVPDIEAYAPSVQAVFGQYGPEDARHVPFSLADRRGRGREPLFLALEFLLSLPERRFTAAEVLDLLDVPAVRRRFGLGEAELPAVHRWVRQAGVRWGLDGAQRAGLGLPAGLEQNTWRFGLARMLLGHASGDGPAWGEVAPYPEIGGLDAAALGPLALLLDALEEALATLSTPAQPEEWGRRLTALMAGFFLARGDEEALALSRLDGLLAQWLDACGDARLAEPLPLAVVREAWLSGLDAGGLSQRFMGGAVNFCTLMPMRAIPFRVVCLLGMNDGDYPRQRAGADFDLMAGEHRPGDRSRREDDRYLFLEALLSAREHLHLSWVGRSARDNTVRPPSVLVGQLRDHLAAGWRAPDGELLPALTLEHPLQPFNPACFGAADARRFSYAREWLLPGPGIGDAGAEAGDGEALAALSPLPVLTVALLARFLRNPVRAFFNERLKVRFEEGEDELEDSEPFALGALGEAALAGELMAAALPHGGDGAAVRAALAGAGQAMRRRGVLPLAGAGELLLERLCAPMPDLAARHAARLARWPRPLAEAARLEQVAPAGPALADWLSGLRADEGGRLALIRPLARELGGKGERQWRHLTAPWAAHLAANACGLALATVLVAPDGDLALPALAHGEARAVLDELLAAWREGMRRPLPVALSAACAWLEDGEGASRTRYEGSPRHPGEVAWCPYLARQYPDFRALQGDGEFPAWAERLYRPLLACVAAGEAGA